MKNILRIVKLTKPLIRIELFLSTLVLVSVVLQQISPIVNKSIVDEIESNIRGQDSSTETLFILIFISFGISVLGALFSSFGERLGDHFSAELQRYLTERFYEKVLFLPQSYFDSEISGKILNQLNRGIVSIKGFVNTATNFILPTILQTVFTIAILFYYNIPTAIFISLLFPIYIVISYYSSKKWGEKEEIKNQIEDDQRGRIQEVISNIKMVKSFNNEQREYEIVSGQLDASNKIYAKQSSTFHLYDFLRNFSLNLVLLGVNAIVFYSTYQGRLTLGEMVLIIQLVTMVRRPLYAMSFILTQLQNTEKGSKEFFEVVDLEAQGKLSDEIEYRRIKSPKIEFNNINFGYGDQEGVIKDMSFKLKSPEKVALVGHSGAGKTTIVNLILKYYEPDSGEILLNDKRYSKLDARFIRHNIALVFQDNELFSTTIRENVAYGMQAEDNEIIDALKKANAYDFVKNFDKGLDTKVGERGVRLSGGQKQRIQIARAILNDPPILILDEATSSLDSRSEALVQGALENLMHNRLVIIIAHRLSTIQDVDRILVINDGQIVNQGSPSELANKRGIYSDLLKYQVEGNKKLLKNYGISQ